MGRRRLRSGAAATLLEYEDSTPPPVVARRRGPNGQVLAGSMAGVGRLPARVIPFARTVRRAGICASQSLGLGAFASNDMALPRSQPIYQAKMAAGGLRAAFTSGPAAFEPFPASTPGNWDSETGLGDDTYYGWTDDDTVGDGLTVGQTAMTSAVKGCIEYDRDLAGIDPAENKWTAALVGRGGLQIASLIAGAPQWQKFLATPPKMQFFADAAGELLQFEFMHFWGMQADVLSTVGTSANRAKMMLKLLADTGYNAVLPYNQATAEVTGVVRPFFMLQTQVSHRQGQSQRCAWGQVEAAQESDIIEMPIPDWHNKRFGDRLHASPNGYRFAGDLLARAIHQRCTLGRPIDAFHAKRATYRLGQVFVETHCPGAFISSGLGAILNTSGMAATPQNGACWIDDSGEVALSNPAIVGDGTVIRLDAARAPGKNAWLRFASDKWSTSMAANTNGPWPALAASCDWYVASSDIGKTSGLPLHHVMPAHRVRIAA